MSRHNKVNPDHYTTQGRLSQDDLARERRKQSESQFGVGRAKSRKAMPPWMANGTATDNDGDQVGAGADPSAFEAARDAGDEDNADAAAQPQNMAEKKTERGKKNIGRQQTGASTRGTARTAAKPTASRPSAVKGGAKQAAASSKRKAPTKTATRAGASRAGAAKKDPRQSAAKKAGPKKAGNKKTGVKKSVSKKSGTKKAAKTTRSR